MKLKSNFHSISYVISLADNNKTQKYVSAKVRLEVVYEDDDGDEREEDFAEYQAVYDLNGEFIEDEFMEE